ncbi:MAG: sugar ABC transporter permease [Oscillatoriales cyanobacterium SM2_2_1]|nr:sugar ABC transporter permease [Oscillatoriales cyanobacterium SM2_2_1]
MRVWVPYLFLLPSIALLLVTTGLPIAQAVAYSFAEYDLVSPLQWRGWSNYGRLWGDRAFWQTLGTTMQLTLWIVPPLVLLPLGLAILVNRARGLMTLWRAIYYVPVLVSVVVAAIAWKWVYSESGLLNRLLGTSLPWLTDQRWVLPAIAVVVIWRGLGYYMTIYLAGLQSIPAELYEAAALDGVTGWERHWWITLPLMRPYMVLVLTVSAIASMKIFEEVYLLTQGGPANSSKTVVYYLFEKGFTELDMGYASAMGVVLMGVILGLTLGLYQLGRERSPHPK